MEGQEPDGKTQTTTAAESVAMTTTTTTAPGRGGSRRRPALSQADIRNIFTSINGGGSPPVGLPRRWGAPPPPVPFRIIVVPKFGDNHGLKLSPPPYEYEEGVYVLVRMNVRIPTELSDRVLLHCDLALKPERPWSLSGPQYSGPTISLQQRYCTPKGNEDAYRGQMKGSLWTLVGPDGKELFDCRVFQVYRSLKRPIANTSDGSAMKAKKPKLPRSSPESKKSPLPDAPRKAPLPDDPPKAPLPDALTQAPLPYVPPEAPLPEAHALLKLKGYSEAAKGLFSPSKTEPPAPKPKKPKRKRLPAAGKKQCKSTPLGNARQTTRSWSAEEDAVLARLVGRSPDVARIAWNLLAQQMGCRTGKQCRERYVNHLKADRKRGRWTESEDDRIVYLQAALGNQWARIAAALPGRSDNDVKNRWHSRMRSQKRKEVKHRGIKMADRGYDDGLETAPPKGGEMGLESWGDLAEGGELQEGSAGPKTGPGSEMPKIGQRVQVKFAGGKMYSGTITKVSPVEESSTERVRFNVTIHYDDGNSEEALLPDKDIFLLPMKNKLNENEVLLCRELLNLHTALQKPDVPQDTDALDTDPLDTDEAADGTAEEGSTEGSSSLQESEGDGCEDSVERDADGTLSHSKPAANETPEEISMPTQEASVEPEPSQSNVEASAANARGRHHPAVSWERGAPPRADRPPVALNFQAPAFRPRPPSMPSMPAGRGGIPPQLVAAARLLSSVNPGLAIAAIASARQFAGTGGQPGQHQRAGALFPQRRFPPFPPNNGFPPRQFSYPPPVTSLYVPGGVQMGRGEERRAALPDSTGTFPNSDEKRK